MNQQKPAITTVGTGNVFADLGLSQPDVRMAKAEIAILIERAIAELGLTQARAAERMGLTQPEVSGIVRGILKGFTLERLLECLNSLGREIEITVRSAEGPAGHIVVNDMAVVIAREEMSSPGAESVSLQPA